MHTDLESWLIASLKDAAAACGYPVEGELFLEFPADSRFGDLSSTLALRISKSTGTPPREVAVMLTEKLQSALARSPHRDYVRQLKVEGAGFINWYLSDQYFYDQLSGMLAEGADFFRRQAGEGRKVLIEFVSANPTGPLSVAHARQAVVGDVLANILSFLGFTVSREYYLNDEGNQINILGASIQLRLKELRGEPVTFPDDHYQGDYIVEIARQLHEKGLVVDDFPSYGADALLAVIKQELADFGIRFDCWYSQKQLRRSGAIDEALAFLKEKGFLYEQDGALWFASTRLGDDKDRVVVKSDGSFTYLAPDIAYHRTKYDRGFNRLINLWGPDHHGYINRLKAAVQALGHDADSLSIIIVQLATLLRDGKVIEMSTRRGQYITLRQVLDEVGCDAARFFFVMRRTSSHLDFDLEVAKKQTPENPVYYVQYAHARIASILRNAAAASLPVADTLKLLKEKEELALIKKLLQFSSILCACRKSEDPSMLTVYLQEAAESFHRFYDQHRVLGEDPALSTARLGLIRAVKTVLSAGLGLLGVAAPEKM